MCLAVSVIDCLLFSIELMPLHSLNYLNLRHPILVAIIHSIHMHHWLHRVIHWVRHLLHHHRELLLSSNLIHNIMTNLIINREVLRYHKINPMWLQFIIIRLYNNLGSLNGSLSLWPQDHINYNDKYNN